MSVLIGVAPTNKSESIPFNESIARQIQIGILMSEDGQTDPLNFHDIFTENRKECIQKIGIGLHSEVFGFANEKIAIKLVPFGGDISFHGRPQMETSEVIHELKITKVISNLRLKDMNSESSSPNFAFLHRANVLQGPMPKYLTNAPRNCEIPPSLQFIEHNNFPANQLWMAFEFEYRGQALTNNWPSCGRARLSVFTQAALALAVAERRLELEHRDLHIGNVLISRSNNFSEMDCEIHPEHTIINGSEYQPLSGPKTTIVDFACSRLQNGSSVHFIDMTEKCNRVRVKTGSIGIMYGIMEDVVGNSWSEFHPQTNVYWLSFLLLWLLDSEKPHKCVIHTNFNMNEAKESITRLLGKCDSALEFIQRGKEAFRGLIFE